MIAPDFLKVKIDAIPTGGLKLEENLPQSFLSGLLAEPGKEISWSAALSAKVEFNLSRHNTESEEVFLKASGEFKLASPCVRCLESREFLLTLKINSLLLPNSKKPKEELEDFDSLDDNEILESEHGISYFNNKTIDLKEILREELFLQLPLHPACDDDLVLGDVACDFMALKEDINTKYAKEAGPFSGLSHLAANDIN